MTKISDAIRTVTADKKVTADEWKNVLKPVADAAPKEASADAREVVKLWASDGFEVDSAARRGMRDFLQSRGYEVPTAKPSGAKPAELEQAVIASNVTEADAAFQGLAKAAGRESAEQTIAVLDSGFGIDHEGLDTKLWTNPGETAGDDVDNDGNGKVDDLHGWDFVDDDANVNSGEAGGHATHVTGIATQGSDNINSISMRVFSPFDAQQVADAIDYAAANGAKVMNMSFRVSDEESVKTLVDAMKRHPEVLFVKSAGNDGRDIDTYDADAYLPFRELENMAVVSAADPDGTKADYSNYGSPWATHATRGSDVVSTVPGGDYEAMSGTSMAAPGLTNLAAKMLILDPALKPADLKKMMAQTTDRSDAWKDVTASGGLLNEQKAYELAALTGLMRRGVPADTAAEQLALSEASRAELLPLAQEYVK
ncbi:MAG: S8 family serine peptidase [Myxococcaceae bacterium]|nr:S8 family serine peptidase [Myxococcaceae bacterium]